MFTEYVLLPMFEGVQEALERSNFHKLQVAQSTSVKKGRIQLKRNRVWEGIRHSEWTRKQGHGHTWW